MDEDGAGRSNAQVMFAVVHARGHFVKSFADITDAMVFLRKTCPPGSRVMKGKTVLAVRVATTGSKATMKGALRGAKADNWRELEDDEETVH